MQEIYLIPTSNILVLFTLKIFEKNLAPLTVL